MKTTSDIYFLDINGKVYDSSLNEINESEVIRSHYSLLLHDDYFFYETLETNFPKSSKTKLLVKNYLSGTYPETLLEDIYLLKKEKLIAIIPTKKYREISSSLLENAEQLSTIAIEQFINNKNCIIFFEGYSIKIDNGIYYLPNTTSNTSNLKDFNINSLSYNLLKDDKKSDFKILMAPLVVVCIALVLFIVGNIFKIKKLDMEIATLGNKIEEVYQKANITDKIDPYGKLLFKVQQNAIKEINILENYLFIAKSFSQNDVIDTLNYADKYFKISGKTLDFKALDKLKNNLSNYYETVEILNTKIEKDFLTFSLRVANAKK
ncbi:hypothetical protein LF845_11570 [Deferribacterales bacterium Es71-Z0220]|jgi:hypothetical protein|uniref:hypothetical protein n=1 Tax=Deferrivibrio essentukiensis TaxID=2880922 RepID=UPI001F61BB75|nr:hypothetical protein [Deferrivibrio essentukiensis]MBZ4671819.1 hypothetical protein [Deferribacteraceae bacterium]MCB4205581.1 hypothetical protein [Deferrivibrio essentukiensis]